MLTDILTLERPLVCIDLEATGIDVESDRICQLGIVKLYPEGRLTEWQTLVNPGVPIPKEASDVHGITTEVLTLCNTCLYSFDLHPNERCEKYAPVPTFASLAPVLNAGLNDSDLAGYNIANFDVKMLRKEFWRANIVWTPNKMIDGFKMAQRANPRNLEWFVAEYVLKDESGNPTNEQIDFKAHDALHDARQSLRGIEGLLRRHKDFPRDIVSLHDMFFVIPRDSNSLDPDAKLVWRNGEACIGFGKKHHGKTLREVKALDPGYLRNFIMKGDFNDAIKKIVEDALNGTFPVKS